MARRTGDKYTRIMSLIFLGFVLVVLWIIAPMLVPVWRWTELSFADVAAEHDIPVEALSASRPTDFYHLPRHEYDPMPWVMLVRSGDETPGWVTDPDGEPVDEYQTMVRVEVLNDHTGEPPSLTFAGGTRYDGWYHAEAWRLPAGALGRSHTRPVVVVNGWTWEKWDLTRVKNLQPTIKHGLRTGEWIRDDDPDMGFYWRRDLFGDRLLAGEPIEPPPGAEAEGEDAE